MFKINIFYKIYLSFLLTIIFTMGLMTLLDNLTGSGPLIDRLRQDIDRSLSFYAQESLRIYQQNGLASLNEFTGRMEKSTQIKIFLFDQKENEITGRRINDEIKSIAGKARKNSKTEFILGRKSSMAARKLLDSKGNVFVFAAVFPNPKHPFVPGRPEGDISERPPGRPGSDRPRHFLPPPVLPGKPPGILNSDRFHRPLPPPEMGSVPPKMRSISRFTGLPIHFLIRILIELLIAGFVCYLLARYLTKPIAKLGDASRQLASGNLSIRVSPSLKKGNDEIYRLAVDFDHMAERIEKLVTAKRNLLRDVSHELRSPLARLNVALAIYKQRAGVETDPSLDRIECESEKLNGLIGRLLTWNMIEAGAMETKKTEVNLEQLVREVVADADYEAKSKNKSICSTAEPCMIKGNRELLRSAIDNIIRNAVYYTNENTPVEVTLKIIRNVENCLAQICVRDHGQGVPEDTLANLFEPFYRVEKGRDRESGGVGLGLAIANAAVRMHGGTIRAGNAEGGGLLIEILLPLETNQHSHESAERQF